MPRCSELVAARPCRRDAIEGQVRCQKCQDKINQRETIAGPIRPGGCCKIMTTGRRCDRLAEENSTICKTHRLTDERVRRQREHIATLEREYQQRAGVIRENALQVPWFDALQMVHLDYRGGNMHRQTFIRLTQMFRAFYPDDETINRLDNVNLALRQTAVLPMEMTEADREIFIQTHVRPAPPPPIGEIGRLAVDKQNVHTKVVSDQTNTGLNKLLSMPIPFDHNTRARVFRAFHVIYAFNDANIKMCTNVEQDINIWYETESCREAGDRLYKRTLDGAWALILTYQDETKKTLIKRLYEECKDSYQMCAEGHICRLINVFSGFDDAFKPVKSLNERIQEALSHISLQNISHADKIELAKKEFDTLGVSEIDRAPWIEAL
jgi:hypothetical protein